MNKFLIPFTVLIALPFMGCGAKSGKSTASGGVDMPPWAMDQPDLCGVGIVKYRGNLGSAKSAAESKARVDISTQIETKVSSMVKNYNSEGGTADGDFSEEKIDQVSKTLSKQTLNGAIPKKAYISKTDQQYFSLVCLNPGVLTDAINNMKELGAAQRKALAKRAEKAHEDLDKAMENY